MPATFTLPADTQAPFLGDPAGNMNKVVDALIATGVPYSVLNAAYAGGADPTGSADSTAAISAAVAAAAAAGRPVYIPAGTYKISSALDWRIAGLNVMGDGPQKTIISQVTSNTPVAMVAGQGQRISGMRLGYAVQQANTSTNAICLQLGDDSAGDCFMSRFSDLLLYQGCRGMQINPALVASAGLFSCQFDNVRVLGWSDRAIYLNAAAGSGAANCTGCVFNNTYLHNNNTGPPSSSLNAPVHLVGWDEIVFNQLNIEHSNVFNTDVVQAQRVGNLVINSLHLEGIQLSGASGDSGYFGIGDASAVLVRGMSVRFSTLSGSTDNPVARFFGNGSSLAVAGYNEPSDVTVGGAGSHPWADFAGHTGCTVAISSTVASQVNGGAIGSAAGDLLQVAPYASQPATAPVSVSGTTETVIASITAPGGLLPGATYRIRVWGTFAMGATGAAYTVRSRIGGLAGAQIGSIVSTAWANSATGSFTLDAIVQLQQAGGSANWTGDLRHNAIAGGTVSNAGQAGNATRDSTVSQAFAVTLQLGNAGNSATATGAIAERIA